LLNPLFGRRSLQDSAAATLRNAIPIRIDPPMLQVELQQTAEPRAGI